MPHEIPLEDRARVLELDPLIRPLMAEQARLFQMDDYRYRDLEETVEARILAAHRRLLRRRRLGLERARADLHRLGRRARRVAIERVFRRLVR